MIEYKYYEYDGNDPGLEAIEYDGADYTPDEFGERIGPQDSAPNEAGAVSSEQEMADAAHIEDGFRETIRSENDYLLDQIDDQTLHEAAQDDYSGPRPDPTR